MDDLLIKTLLDVFISEFLWNNICVDRFAILRYRKKPTSADWNAAG